MAALADDYVRAYFRRFPEAATIYGVPGASHDRLVDPSLDAVARWREREDGWLEALRALDPPDPGEGPDHATYGILRELLEASVEMRVCRAELWNVNQLDGWHVRLAVLGEMQPVGTDEARGEALERWSRVPRYVDAEIGNLRAGMERGYTAPRRNVELVLAQLDDLLKTPARASPLWAPARRDGDGPFGDALADIIEEAIHPALARYRAFLHETYLPGAREAIAVTTLPDAAGAYEACVRYHTSLRRSAGEIHELGLEEVARIEEEMRAVARRSFGTSDVPALLERLRTSPEHTFGSRDEVVACSRAAVERARRAVPRWFGLVPAAKVRIERYPAFRERSAGGEYNPPTEDGGRPGVFYISTYDPGSRSRMGQEAIAFHETLPGHHLQIAVALERGERNHPVARYFHNSGYIEGWALYAERLADEMGLYSSDVDRLGMLSTRAFRAARLVVDPGIHALGWSRDRAIRYLLAHATQPEAGVAAEVDRYVILPGQSTAYMLGFLELRRLRERAERELGPAFDVRAFHDRILEDGAVPLPLLRGKIERWIGETAGEGGPGGGASGRPPGRGGP